MTQRIYLDHNATTPLAPEAYAAMTPYLKGLAGNASSIHWAGTEAKKAMAQARAELGGFLNADPEEIIFTSGATESINTVLKGCFTPGIGMKNELIISAVEHPATLEAAESLMNWGVSVVTLPVDAMGRITVDDLAERIGPTTGLVSILWANNEIGNLYPIGEIAELCQTRAVLLHVDAAQAVGKVSINLKECPVDFLSLSGHKFYGPQGVGALYLRRGRHLRRFHDGGAQERSRRGGTENVAGIVGLGAAAALAARRMTEDNRRAAGLISLLSEGLSQRLPHTKIYGDLKHRLANTLSVGFPGLASEALLIALDLAGIAASAGAACSSGTLEPSHVLLAMGTTTAEARSAIRFSVGRGNTVGEIQHLLELLPELIRQLKAA